MHNRKALEIKTATITIKVVKLDGHKMTKATYEQIPLDDDADKDLILGIIKDGKDPCGLDVLGWVNRRKGPDEILVSDNGNIERLAFKIDYGGWKGCVPTSSGFWDSIKSRIDQIYIAT